MTVSYAGSDVKGGKETEGGNIGHIKKLGADTPNGWSIPGQVIMSTTA
jgi:hypothetical protein